MIYLDNSATTRAFDSVAQAVHTAMVEDYANPAGVYRMAVQADKLVEGARERLAQSLGAAANEIVYTSGATESNNLAVFGLANALRKRRKRFITTMVEHPSVFETFRALEAGGQEVIYLNVNKDGTVRLDQLAEALNDNTLLVSIMHVNNEVGAVNDLERISAIIQRSAPQAVFHSDGVQAYGKLPFTSVPAHMYSLSGHKFHGPKGVGALLIRQNVRIGKGLLGGSQERGIRSGTLNTPGILGMDAAVSHYMAEGQAIRAKLFACKKRLVELITSELSDVYINGPEIEYGAPNILNMSFPGVLGEILLHSLEEREIFISTGSACSQKKQNAVNRTLNSMGITGRRAEGAIRFSIGAFNEIGEMDTVAQVVVEQVNMLRKYAR